MVRDIERPRAGGWHDRVVRDIVSRQNHERLGLLLRTGILDEDEGAISLAGQQQVAIWEQLQAVRIGDRQRLSLPGDEVGTGVAKAQDAGGLQLRFV